jgi:putative salt-induced outer membrane protein YdiY
MRRTLVLSWFSLCLLAAEAQADQITLKNGDRLTGSIVKLDPDGKKLLIKTEMAGDVTVSFDAVTVVVSSQPLHLTLSDGRVVIGTLSTREGTLEVATKDSGTVSAPRESIKAIRNDAEQIQFDRSQHPRLFDYWSGLFDFGLSRTQGNSSTSSLTIAAKAARVVPKNKLGLYYTEVYSKDTALNPAVTTANAIHGGVRDEFNLNPSVFVFAFTDFDEDALQHLDLRNVIGGGFGYHLIHSKNTTFDLFGGSSFDQEYFSAYTIANPTPPPAVTAVAAVTRHDAEVVAGQSLSTKLGPRTSLSEQVSLFPNLSSTGNYRITFDASASTKLKSWLSWQVTFNDRYISNPPLGLKGNDQLLSTGLRLTFGKGIF